MEVTNLLENAAAQLRVGEMLHTEDFDLFHVMSAVEIGDPRLDAGESSILPIALSVKSYLVQVLM